MQYLPLKLGSSFLTITGRSDFSFRGAPGRSGKASWRSVEGSWRSVEKCMTRTHMIHLCYFINYMWCMMLYTCIEAPLLMSISFYWGKWYFHSSFRCKWIHVLEKVKSSSIPIEWWIVIYIHFYIYMRLSDYNYAHIYWWI